MAAAVTSIASALAVAGTVINHIASLGLDEKEARNHWTREYVASIARSQPGYNVLLIYSRHVVNLQGVIHQGQVPYKLGTGFSIEYTLYIFESGTVDLLGDGGFLNWAFQGKFEQNGGHVVFHKQR